MILKFVASVCILVCCLLVFGVFLIWALFQTLFWRPKAIVTFFEDIWDMGIDTFWELLSKPWEKESGI